MVYSTLFSTTSPWPGEDKMWDTKYMVKGQWPGELGWQQLWFAFVLAWGHSMLFF